MSKSKPAVEDVAPADLGDTPVADLRDAEIAALRAENEALKAGVNGVFPPGLRYLVKLEDGPAWVVEPAAGEHPFEAYKRATGVISSQNTPEIHPTESPVGRAA